MFGALNIYSYIYHMRKLDELIAYTLNYHCKGCTKDTYGIWEARGEDPNCDLGGYHHTPLLGYFKGTLGDVMAHVSKMEKLRKFFLRQRIILIRFD